MKLPEISVIVCCFNHAKWIERCIRSLNHQQHMEGIGFEVVVLDDGSSDESVDVVQNLDVIPNLRIIEQDENKGLPASLNHAIKKSRGRYVVRVDSDDYLTRDCLYIMYRYLQANRNYQAVAVDYIRVDELDNHIERVNSSEEPIACGIMFRKECLFEIGLYDEEFKMREGHDLRKRFEERYAIGHLEFPFYRYRDHASNRTKNRDEVARYDARLTSGEAREE